MTIPAYFLGFLISTLYGAVFHLLRGGSFGRLLLYIILGWAGFWSGQIAATLLTWNIFSLGPLRLGMATLGSLIFLGVGYWLSLIDSDGS